RARAVPELLPPPRRRAGRRLQPLARRDGRRLRADHEPHEGPRARQRAARARRGRPTEAERRRRLPDLLRPQETTRRAGRRPLPRARRANPRRPPLPPTVVLRTVTKRVEGGRRPAL